jgi:hypothetical protein
LTCWYLTMTGVCKSRRTRKLALRDHVPPLSSLVLCQHQRVVAFEHLIQSQSLTVWALCDINQEMITAVELRRVAVWMRSDQVQDAITQVKSDDHLDHECVSIETLLRDKKLSRGIYGALICDPSNIHDAAKCAPSHLLCFMTTADAYLCCAKRVLSSFPII